jgi:lysophospholipase L1-like esterase
MTGPSGTVIRYTQSASGTLGPFMAELSYKVTCSLGSADVYESWRDQVQPVGYSVDLTGGITDLQAGGRSAINDLGLRKQQFLPRPTIFPGVNSDVPTLALSGPGGSTPVSTSVLLPYNTNKVRLAGCIPTFLNALGTDYYTNTASGVGGSGATICAVEFEGYFDDIALVFRNAVNSRSSFWVWANDPTAGIWKPTTAAPTVVAAANANSQFYERITFGAAAQRQVRIYLYLADFGGIYVKPTQTLAPSAPAARNVCVIGDSYCAGALTIEQPTTWPVSLARMFGADLFLNAVGGTGYTQLNAGAGGNNNYAASPRVAAAIASAATDFIIAGSINDSSQTTASVTANAQSLITQIKSALPTARLWMTGVQGLPVAAAATGTNSTNNTALAALAVTNNIPFIDTFTTWYSGTGYAGATNGTGNRDIFCNTDQIHPTQAGHDFIASRMYQELIRLGW